MTTADEESRKVALISSKVLNNAMEGYAVQKQKETMSSKPKNMIPRDQYIVTLESSRMYAAISRL